MLRSIAGLEEITSGTLEIAGEVVNDVPPSKRGIAMVFQSYALYPHMTVYDNMAFGMKIARESKAEIDRRVRQAADILQLTKYLDRLPKALSGGQRQRVAIGRAIVRNPKVFLFDEPLSNLDAALRVATRIEIAKLKESMPNTTMIYVTHDQVEAMTLADRIVVLKDGHIEQVGTPMELYKNPGNLFVAQFIGSPAMNILPANDREGRRADRRHRMSAAARRRCRSKRRPPPPALRSASACGRRISPSRPARSYLFEGLIDYVEQLGEVQLVYVDIGRPDLPLVVKLPGNAEVKRGETLAARCGSHRPAHLRRRRPFVRAKDGGRASGLTGSACSRGSSATAGMLLRGRPRCLAGASGSSPASTAWLSARLMSSGAIRLSSSARRSWSFSNLVAAHRLVDRHMHGVTFGRDRLHQQPAAGRQRGQDAPEVALVGGLAACSREAPARARCATATASAVPSGATVPKALRW